MVPITNISAGIAKYADREILPKLPDGSWQKVIAGMGISIAAKRGEAIAQSMAENQMLKTMAVVDSGQVDIDLLRETLKDRIPDAGMVIALPVIGTMTFHKDDVDKLYSCIIEG